jgi:hypothetical protein
MRKPSHTQKIDSNVLIFDSNPQKVNFIGAKAIFDPNFIPPKVIMREKPAHSLQGIISDAITDHYTTNVTLYGMKGIGKNLLINMSLDQIKEQFLSNNTEVMIVKVDCNKKDLTQIFFNIISQLNPLLSNTLELQDIANLNTSKLWNLLKYLIQKKDSPIIIYLKNPEEIPSEHMNKIFSFAKTTNNLQVITSLNTGAQRYSFKQYENMDNHIPLDIFTTPELYDITADRAIMTFQNPIASEAVQNIVDFVTEFDVKVPGSCINMLKEIYPIIQNKNGLSAEDLREVSQYYFEGFSLDALTMADFVMQTTIEDRLFLDYLINYFQKPNHFYIPFKEIKKAFMMTSEELGFQPYKREFYQSFGKILNAQILRPSNCKLSKTIEPQYGVIPVDHFLTLPLSEVSEIMKVSFGEIGDIPENQKLSDRQ